MIFTSGSNRSDERNAFSVSPRPCFSSPLATTVNRSSVGVINRQFIFPPPPEKKRKKKPRKTLGPRLVVSLATCSPHFFGRKSVNVWIFFFIIFKPLRKLLFPQFRFRRLKAFSWRWWCIFFFLCKDFSRRISFGSFFFSRTFWRDKIEIRTSAVYVILISFEFKRQSKDVAERCVVFMVIWKFQIFTFLRPIKTVTSHGRNEMWGARRERHVGAGGPTLLEIEGVHLGDAWTKNK